MAGASERARRQGGFVLDCSVALAWCFPDERSPYPASVLDSLATRRAVAPALWPFEVANALLSGERRRRSSSADTAAWLRFLGELPIGVDEEAAARAWEGVLGLARRHRLSAYDAAYLELALRLHLPLATLDRHLRVAMAAAGVPLFAV